MKEDEGGGMRRLEWRRRLGAFGDGDFVGLGVTVIKPKTAGGSGCVVGFAILMRHVAGRGVRASFKLRFARIRFSNFFFLFT